MATSDLLVGCGIADRARLACFELSMGTRYGLDAAALTPEHALEVWQSFITLASAQRHGWRLVAIEHATEMIPDQVLWITHQ